MTSAILKVGRPVALAAILISLSAAQRAEAAEPWVPCGSGCWTSHVFIGDAEHDIASLTVEYRLVQDPSSSAGVYSVLTTILSLDVSAGWTARIKKDGGIDSAVEILFENTEGCSRKYRSLVIPGLTKIDGGPIKCKHKRAKR